MSDTTVTITLTVSYADAQKIIAYAESLAVPAPEPDDLDPADALISRMIQAGIPTHQIVASVDLPRSTAYRRIKEIRSMFA